MAGIAMRNHLIAFDFKVMNNSFFFRKRDNFIVSNYNTSNLNTKSNLKTLKDDAASRLIA